MNSEQDALTKVMTFGTFDVLHAGHEFYLRRAREMGDYLIVVVARDNTVQKVKGEAPYHDERERLNKVKELEIADKVVLGYEDDKYRVIRKYKPDIIALGHDQFAFTYKLKKLIIDENLDTKIVRMEAYEPGIYKSSLIKAQLDEEDEEQFGE